MEVSAWKQLYAHVVADADGDAKMTSASAAASSSSSSKDSVVQFLESVLAPTSPSAKASSPAQQQPPLADIGKELLVPVVELSTMKLTKEQGLDRDAVMRVLQLQVICRMLCCCEMKKTSTKRRKAKQATPSSSASQLKLLKKELRSLLDRIALLLDAANPPSLTDEDERSPFHEFLQDVLAKAFATRLPKLVKFLLAIYELEGETRALDNLTLNPAISLVKPVEIAPPQAPATVPPAAAAPSILSALLRDEQRPIKRSRTETVVPFKKMEIPNELRRRSSFPSTRKDLLKAVKNNGKGASPSTSTSSPAIPRSSSSTDKSLSRSSSKSRAVKSAEKPSLTPQSSLGQRSTPGSKGAPLLMRNVDRALFAGPQSRFTPSASNNTPHTIVTSGGPSRLLSASKHPLLATTPKNFKPVMPGAAPVVAVPGAPTSAKPTGAPRTAVSNLIKNERTSVVMRTPDRPQRRPHRTARVLIESSPPFRNPNVGAGAAARQRKQPTAIPPPLLR
ncbi:hypothetical protein Gpo141_00004183 [Globisporangium polare]